MRQDCHNEQIVRPLDVTWGRGRTVRSRLTNLTPGGSASGEAAPSDSARNSSACNIDRRREQNLPHAAIVNPERHRPATVVVEMGIEITG